MSRSSLRSHQVMVSRPRRAVGSLASFAGSHISSDRGQGTVELALVVPLLLVLFLGVVEASRALSFEHQIAVLSREGANIASRGSSLDETLTVVLANSTDLGLSTRGGVIVSRIVIQGTTPVVEAQEASTGYEERSLLGLPDSIVTALNGVDFDDGQTLHAVEVFLGYSEITPLSSFVGDFVGTLYERAIF